MATWRPDELRVVEAFLDEKGNVEAVRDEEFVELQLRLPGRSAAGIKKKFHAMKKARRTDGEIPQGRVRQSTAVRWTEEEDELLQELYLQQVEENKAARVKNFVHRFPRRTAATLVKRLRDNFPEIYYLRTPAPVAMLELMRRRERRVRPGMETNGAPGGLTRVENMSNEAPLQGAREIQNQPGAEVGETQHLVPEPVDVIYTDHINHVGDSSNNNNGNSNNSIAINANIVEMTTTRAACTTRTTRPATARVTRISKTPTASASTQSQGNQPTTERPTGIELEFRRTLGALKRNRQSPRFRSVKLRVFINQNVLNVIDDILHREIESVRERQLPEAKERKKIKEAILAALITAKEQCATPTQQQAPNYVKTSRALIKLRKKVQVAKSLRWSRRLNAEQTALAKELRNTHCSLNAYITKWQDRVEILEERAVQQKQRHDDKVLREKYQANPAKKTIEEKPPKCELEVQDVENYYKKLYSAEKGSREPTPIFNGWLGNLKAHQATCECEVLDEKRVREIIEDRIRETRPWKAPGHDGIPMGAYKLFKSAKQYLMSYIVDTLNGNKHISEVDVRGRVVLLYKAGDKKDPANYRPIALLNIDYKILTGVITQLIQDKLPSWAIPREQMARKDVWGTMHGMLLDKAHSQTARRAGRTQGVAYNYSMWYDFSKAYDSIHHFQILRLVNTLPIPVGARNTLAAAIKRWSVEIQVGKNKTKPVHVKRGVYQGDSSSPMLFILASASILNQLKADREVNNITKGKHTVIAFMDDIKCHAKTREAVDKLTHVLKESAKEIGLQLNKKKCGMYFKRSEIETPEADEEPNSEDDERVINQAGDGIADEEERRKVREEADFLPQVRDGYKYLGITQLERDTSLNGTLVREKVLEELRRIMDSKLAVPQKIHLYNTSTIPAATYVLGNLYPDEHRRKTLNRCKRLDKEVRAVLVEKGVKQLTCSTASVHLPGSHGGYGVKSILEEVELHHVKRGLYIMLHPEMKDTLDKFRVLQRQNYRNPLTDCEKILEKYGVEPITEDQQRRARVGIEVIEAMAILRTKANEITKKQLECRMYDWSDTMHYGKVVKEKIKQISFPWLKSIHLEAWCARVIHAAMEEQLQAYGSIPGTRRKCRKGCTSDETAYHVASSCLASDYIERHNSNVYWLLKTVLEATRAPMEVRSKLRFNSATLNARYELGSGGDLVIRAGGPVALDVPLRNNKPDIIISTTRPKKMYVIEVAVSHIQNLGVQERIKRTKYAVNSEVDVSHMNVDSVMRGVNLVAQMKREHGCQVSLAVIVLGCYGEVLLTDELRAATTLLGELGVSRRRMRRCLDKCSSSNASNTAKLLLRRITNTRLS